MTTASDRTTLRRVATWALLGVALAAAGVVGWPRASTPVATWQFGPERVTPRPFDEMPRYDAMRLKLDLPFPAFVYVASFDYQRGSVGYFPTEYLGTDVTGTDGTVHHLAAGTHELPGTWDGKEQAWFVPDVTDTISLCVVVSRGRLPELEAVLRLVKQTGNRAFASRAMGMYMPRAGRDALIGQKRLPHDALLAAQNQPDSVADGPMVRWTGHDGVFVKVLNLVPAAPREGAKPPDNPFDAQLRKMVPAPPATDPVESTGSKGTDAGRK